MFEFEIVNPKVDKSKPYYKDGLFIIPKVTSNYNYYLETKIFNKDLGNYEYYLLLSENKFDNNCYKCKKDCFNRIKIRLSKEIIKELNTKNNSEFNINIYYVETTNNYDVYQIETI